jgi:hypothetical protein
MKVVDLRNVFASCNDILIEISDNLIYYAEEKKEEGHNNLFILEYNRVTRRERIVTNYFLSNPAFVQHFFSFPEDIVIVMESSGSETWILRIDKRTGAEKNLAKLNLVGSFADCCVLDESHVMLYTTENEQDRELFQEYQKLTGSGKIAYLYDLDEEKYFYVRDPRVCSANSTGFIPYDYNGEKQLLILQPNGSELQKENSFRNRRWIGDNINDSVWLCPLFDFLVSVKTGEERIPLELILSAGTCGLVRFAGMDEANLYFRAKYFPTGDQRLCAYSKETGKKMVMAELNLGENEKPASFSIDVFGGRAYRITENEDDYQIDGVMNSTVHATYSKELGDFVACVDDRFIIARYILADEKDSFEFNSIYDIQTGNQKSYECSCAVQGGTVVIY